MIKNEKKKRLLIDTNHLAIRTLFSAHGTDWDREGFDMHKHIFMTALLASVVKFDPDEVILAVDSVKNWRKKVYAEYKANRKIKRDSQDFDWNKYFDYFTEFLESLKELPFKILRVPYCEADDVIGVLSKYFIDTDNILVTSDKDYIQLLKYEQNKLYNPIEKKFIKEDNPAKALHIKIIMGDSGDNIPAIKPRTGEKTALKILDSGELQILLDSNETIKENYERNKRLISFDMIPDVLQKTIIKNYKEYHIDEKPIDYFGWFLSHGLRKLSTDITRYLPLLNKLEGEKEDYKGSLLDLFK